MIKYMKAHEKYILDSLEMQGENWTMLAAYHKTQIEFIQHERLVHLLVTLAFGLLLMMAAGISIGAGSVLLIILDLILMVVLTFYIIHYYQLENGIQRWYLLYNDILAKTDEAGGTHVKK